MSEKLNKLFKSVFERAYAMAADGHKNQRRKDGKPYMSHVDAVITNTKSLFNIHGKTLGLTELDYYLTLAVAADHDLYEDHPTEYPLQRIADNLVDELDQVSNSLPDGEDSTAFVMILRVISSINVISKKPKGQEAYSSYVLGVKGDPMARLVKLGDLQHNMSDLEPGNMLDKYDLTRMVLMDGLGSWGIGQK